MALVENNNNSNHHNDTTPSNGDSDSSTNGESKCIYLYPVASYRNTRTVTPKLHLTRSGLTTYSSTTESLTSQDVGFSPVILNTEIQKQRIKYVLDNTLEKLVLTLNMPRLVETNSRLLRRCCTASEMNTVMECYVRYVGGGTPARSPRRRAKYGVSPGRSTVRSTKRRELSAVRRPSTPVPSPTAKSAKRSTTDKQRSYPQVAMAVNILCKSPELRTFAKETFQMNGSETSMLFLEKFRIVRDSLLERMNTPLPSQNHRSMALREIWVKNEEHKAKLQQLKSEWETVRNKYHNDRIEQERIVADYEQQIKHLRWQFEDQHNGCIKTSEAKLKKMLHKSVMTQDAIMTDIDNVQRQLDKLVPAHVDSERKLRRRRLRLESRLEAQISKFDDAMLMRKAECDELMAEINEGKERLAKIQGKVEAQEELYQTIVDEKLDQEQFEFNAKKRFILMVQCARRIQRWWRACRARKKAAEEEERRRKAKKLAKKAKAKAKKADPFRRAAKKK